MVGIEIAAVVVEEEIEEKEAVAVVVAEEEEEEEEDTGHVEVVAPLLPPGKTTTGAMAPARLRGVVLLVVGSNRDRVASPLS